MAKDIYIDELTSIYNEAYLKKIYAEYIKEHPKANFVMMDFEKFKSINDTYGHKVGDDCLKLFACILKNLFKTSIPFRLHGDEFSLLTELNEDEIKKTLEESERKIDEASDKQIIPRSFRVNAGCAPVNPSLSKTSQKADVMMYHTKQNNQHFQGYSDEVWIKRMGELETLRYLDKQISEDSITYSTRQLYSDGNTQTNIIQLYTRDAKGNPIFAGKNYQTLRDDSKLIKFDTYNIKRILSNLDNLGVDSNIMINIDFKSLCLSRELIEYFNVLAASLDISFDKIILSINISGIQETDYDTLIGKIGCIKKLGFKVCMDKYDSSVGDKIWENADIDFVKFNNEYWKAAMKNEKVDYILRRKVEMFSHYHDSSVPIFSVVESKEEHDYITSITTSPILLSGDCFDRGKRLELTR